MGYGNPKMIAKTLLVLCHVPDKNVLPHCMQTHMYRSMVNGELMTMPPWHVYSKFILNRLHTQSNLLRGCLFTS
ncbi:hypothetical protein Hanom_Chr04g00381401 [Helianthus anomalus]